MSTVRIPSWVKLVAAIVGGIFSILLTLQVFTKNPWIQGEQISAIERRQDSADARITALETANASTLTQLTGLTRSIDCIGTDVRAINQNLLQLMRLASHSDYAWRPTIPAPTNSPVL